MKLVIDESLPCFTESTSLTRTGSPSRLFHIAQLYKLFYKTVSLEISNFFESPDLCVHHIRIVHNGIIFEMQLLENVQSASKCTSEYVVSKSVDNVIFS